MELWKYLDPGCNRLLSFAGSYLSYIPSSLTVLIPDKLVGFATPLRNEEIKRLTQAFAKRENKLRFELENQENGKMIADSICQNLLNRMKKIRYNGLGFPIDLKGVKTRKFRGEILPDINHRELEDQVFKTLLWLPAHLSGAHLSFVRGYMGLSQKEFATILGLKTHATISGWEGKENKATRMPGTTEVVIRLLMAEFIKEDGFAPHFKEFLEVTNPPKNLALGYA